MAGETEKRDEREARTIAIGLGILAIAVLVGLYFLVPALADFNARHFAPGMGLKDSAIVAIIATVVILVIFAIAAGDGIIGEIQYMLLGFFAFFLLLWLMIAWVF